MKDAIAAETKQGTTPEILQAYPLGTLEVQVIGFAPFIRSVLVGIDLSDKLLAPCIVAHYSAYSLSQGTGRYKFEQLTPVLSPFSALCDPLPDGTVPAVEVAKLVGGDSPWETTQARTGLVLLTHEEGESRCIIKNITSPSIGWHFDVYMYGRVKQDPLDLLAAYDYLRRNHFATPVNGRPLVEGIDFIAKAAALTMQEGSRE